MSTLDDYDAQVEAIQKHNAPILASFHTSLAQAGLAKKTVKNHVDNIDFFTEYLVSYEPLTRLDEAQKPYRSLTSGRSRSKMSQGVGRGKAATLLGKTYRKLSPQGLFGSRTSEKQEMGFKWRLQDC